MADRQRVAAAPALLRAAHPVRALAPALAAVPDGVTAPDEVMVPEREEPATARESVSVLVASVQVPVRDAMVKATRWIRATLIVQRFV